MHTVSVRSTHIRHSENHWTFYDLKGTKYAEITSVHYLKKVASPVKQNVDTAAVKYTYHCDCQAVPENLRDSNWRLLKKLSASMRHLPK